MQAIPKTYDSLAVAGLRCEREGLFREQIYTDGRFMNELFYGLTRKDFDASYPRLIDWIRSKGAA